MNWYPRQFSVCLTLLIFVALTAGYDYLDGDVTLDSSGLVNIYYKGKWGTICYSSSYAHLMSKAICRSLGLKYSYYKSSYSKIPAYLKAKECRGDENSIMGCPNPYLSTYTYCSQKLSVRCKTNPVESYCSFDSNNCSVAINGTDYVWKRSLSSFSNDAGRPKTDHSTKTRYGKYMFASAVGFPGQKTYLKTKTFTIAANSLSFYYYMSGREMGKLNIYSKSKSRQTLMKTLSGNQGNKWKYACIPLTNKYRNLQIIFEAVQGSGYMSDIAIDDLTMSTNDCSFWNASCNFREDTCNYDIDSTYSRYGWRTSRLSGLSDRSGSGYYQVFKGYYYSTIRASLTSPLLDLPPTKTKVTFYYYMKGSSPGELQLRFVEDEDQNSWHTDASYFWQDSEDHGSLWQYGCMELPTSKKGRIVFHGMSGRKWSGGMALDDIVISKGSCQIGITSRVCTFDNRKFCNYTIDCMNPNEYTWRRNFGSTSSRYTGPSTDHSNDKNGYYLYAEASYGSPNDTTLLNFAVSDVRKKTLSFAYHMYGSTVGNLRVRFTYNDSQYEDVWIREGNQGFYWHKSCVYIPRDISVISFIATKGTSYEGDIALDTISVGSKACGGPFDCDFQERTCKYQSSGYGFRWSIQQEYSYSSDTNSYLYIYSRTNSEDNKFQFFSPHASVTKGTSVSFRYKMTKKAKEFALFARYSSSNETSLTKPTKSITSNSAEKLWFSNGNGLTEFTTACVDLPSSNNLSLLFEVTAKANSYYDSLVYLDNITVSNETCKFGITHHFCEFKEPHFCDYNVECPENSEYTWQRGSYKDVSYYRSHFLPYPENFSYSDSDYYMYTQSSKGQPGHTSKLVFSNIRAPAGKSLYFTYYITKNNGKLQLQSEDSHGNNIELFEESGEIESRNWNFACVNVPNYSRKYTYQFIATHGFGFNGHIALLDVGFKDEYCQARSISCNFSNPMICQYYNFMYSKWERVQSGNVSGSTNDVYMQASPRYNTHGLASPTENITNSCVQIRYKIIGSCNLTIYNAFSKKSLFSVVSRGTTPWLIYQVYIERKMPTKFIFLTQRINSIFYQAVGSSVSLDYINVTKNKCPGLVCPPGTIKCKNEYCFNASKVCDRVRDCSDGSDENNCSENSISCNFTSPYNCGYKLVHGFFHVPEQIPKELASPYLPGTLWTMRSKGEILSPAEILGKSCVKFRYITQGAVVGNISIISHKLNSDGKVTRSLEWNEIFYNDKDGIYEGQIQTQGGNIFFKIKTYLESGSLSLDDITVSKGVCLKLNCPENTFMCPDKTKCIHEKNKCNNYWNCKDGSDENKCPNTLDCPFEDNNMCGCKSFPPYSWVIDFGIRSKNPRYDYSEKSAYGQYMRLNSTKESRLELPKITRASNFCLDFYYIFSGHGNLSVYSNKTLLMTLSKFDAEIWTNAYVTLSKGVHNISFVYSGGNITTLAVDSVVTKSGECPKKDCTENWNTCKYYNTCYPYTEKCNGIENCPNGEDESGCGSNKPKYKLTGGRDLWSGKLKTLSGSEYLTTCAYSLPEWTLNTICSNFGFNGTSYWKRKSEYITGDYIYCYYYGYRYGSLNCYKRSCEQCHCNVPYVFCSNTTCPLGKVSCPSSRNGTNSTNTCIFKESVCDGQPDCDDHSDEEDCDSCTNAQWQCRNKKCIKKDLRCDGNKDCDDGSDEFHCFKYDKNKTMQMFYKGSYRPICEDNLKSDVADKLCSFVGRSNGTFNGSISGKGIVFKHKYSGNDDQLIPGFEPEFISECNITKLECSEQQCGTRMMGSIESSAMSNSGQFALDGEWPWSASVFVNSRYGIGRFISAAILIDTRHVLIPGYSIYTSLENLRIKTGSIWQDNGDEYDVDEIWRPKGFSYGKSINYNIAILHVKDEIKMSRSVQPICLPEHPMPSDGNCFAIGFGADSNRLEEKKVKKVESSYCKKHFPSSGNNTFCVNDNNDDPPSCSFYSGSYVTCPNEHGKWTVYGIGSSMSCYSRELVPSAYTDIYKMKDWIEEKI